jgi:chemotaxis protein methyltransferase CheR
MPPPTLPLVARGELSVPAEPVPAPLLSQAEFDEIRRMAYDHFGLDLREGKQSTVVARLARELRHHGCKSYSQYCQRIRADHTGEALAGMADALTTNFTSFLREEDHFEFLRTEFLAGIAPGQPIDIWCSASSTGEEAWSILFTLLDVLGPAADVNVLATDISTRALTLAADAVYAADRVEPLPEAWRQKYFLRGNGNWQGSWRVKAIYREHVQFRRFNLVTDDLPARTFPAIFCRNVIIYFDRATQAAVTERLASLLPEDGYLFIGHSENLVGLHHGLEYIRPALYRKPRRGILWHNIRGR